MWEVVSFKKRQLAEALQLELKMCAFPCMNSIEVSSDLPGFSDADVFCFITNFPNPNRIDFDNIDTDEQFDTFYLIIKIANNLSKPQPAADNALEESGALKKNKKSQQKARKPIFIADGLVAIDILKSLSKNIPHDVLFCPTSLTSIAKYTLGDYLKVQSNNVLINNVHVWAANDEVFYVEVQKPYIIDDKINVESDCEREVISKDLMESLKLDHTNFNEAWMKKEFFEKIRTTASKNSYGCIYKAAQITKTLHEIWTTRIYQDVTKCYCSMGVVSDGSLGTIKGCPYVLPLIFSGESWIVNKCYEDDTHLKHEIKRINSAVKKHHEKLLPYCKKFLEENVINQAFIPDEESSVFSMTDHSSKLSL
ncbi:hypothetical protein O3G_MSEX001712 [Manduca sexta]|uniref:Malate dehydrogenase n=1 Tax=Manduca sexta TaxID=7130 RepID=A0A921YLD2_MANSE|nr:hypothetical protein O3G_MSEX001712 [Manduca sexta]